MLVKSGGAGASGSLTTGETQYHVRGDGEGCIDTFRQVEQKGPEMNVIECTLGRSWSSFLVV